MQDVFTKIYETNRWNSPESRSGPTSTIARTTKLRKNLPELMGRFNVRTLFDAPCGDLNWMREVLKENDFDYIGGDIVSPMIDRHNSDAELKKRGRFIVIDLTRDRLPPADMMLARDFLFHLSFEDAFAFLRNFAASDIRYLLTTSHINDGKFENRDISTGDWRWMDLFAPPYNFPKETLDSILDGKNDRYLYLWTRAQAAEACRNFGYPQSTKHGESRSEIRSKGVRWIASQARDALASKDFGEALRQAQLLIEEWPDRPDGYLLRAQVLNGAGERRAAFDVLLNSLPLHLNHPKSLSVLRTLAADQGAAEEADRFADRLFEIEPFNRMNLAFLCDRKLKLEDFPGAHEHAVALTIHHRDWVRAWRLLARVQQAQGRPGDALATIREAASLHPHDSKLLKLGRNAALDADDFAAAQEFALELAEVAPSDLANLKWLVIDYMRSKDFHAALKRVSAVIELAPDDTEAVVFKSQCLAALDRPEEALDVLREALVADPDDRSLLETARIIAFQNGDFSEAIKFGLRAIADEQASRKSLNAVALAYLASGDIHGAEQFVDLVRERPAAQQLKAAHYLAELHRLEKISPQVVRAWEAAITNTSVETRPYSRDEGDSASSATMIQYWSQGTPPPDLRLAASRWQQLFERERFGEVRLFDRASAASWIDENAPEFTPLFSQAFHYAMEADIFRIAYASKLPCIYSDIDGWPLQGAPEILRVGLRSRKSMLYFRSFRPWVVNGFFISRPDCPFFKELVQQSLTVRLDELPKNHHTIECAFGPTRYNKVLTDLLFRSPVASVSSCPEILGCSELAIEEGSILFTHEAAVASVKPPFQLDYKLTDDNWKRISLN